MAASGATSGLLFKQPFGARPFALGQAYAALGDDIFALSYNPASLSRLRESQAATQFTQSIADARMGYLGVASPLSPNQALGLSVKYLDLGKAEIFDGNGNSVRTVTAQREYEAQLGYAHSFSLNRGILHLGTAGKILQSAIADEARGGAYAADFGALYEIPRRNDSLLMGLAVSNLGTRVKYTGGLASGSEADPLPLTTRFALGYVRDVFASDRVALGAEIDRVFYDDTMTQGLGIEYDYHRFCALRLGYRAGQDSGGLSMGVGLRVKDLSVDYALGLRQTFNSIQQVSLKYGFTIPGIRYAPDGPASPIETMVKKGQKSIDEKRFFDAAVELERLKTFFPDAHEIGPLRTQIQRETETILIQGAIAPRYEYALGFQNFERHLWKEAVDNLEIAAQQEPNNREIQIYLAQAKSRLENASRQMKLQMQARIATLLELANGAFNQKEYMRARRITEEILRLGPYQPAADLKRRIETATAEPKTLPRSAPPAAAVFPAARATREEMGRAEDFYYDALRDYADNRLEDAIRKLRQGLKLNPASETLKNTLNGMEKELQKLRQSGAP